MAELHLSFLSQRTRRVFLLCLFSLCLCGSPALASETLTIAVASSLYPDMQKKSKVFEQAYDVKVRLIAGSTGRLYHQIQQGAPFDVFVAADDVRPAALLKQGKAVATYTAGKGYLGLIVHGVLVKDLTMLKDSNIQHIAIANPDVAPFGLATKKMLQEHGLWEVLKPKFVYAQNALQTKILVQKGLVDAAFVPISSQHMSVAKLTYRSVLLKDKPLARLWLQNITSQHLSLKSL